MNQFYPIAFEFNVLKKFKQRTYEAHPSFFWLIGRINGYHQFLRIYEKRLPGQKTLPHC
jgi:hypothetical protein